LPDVCRNNRILRHSLIERWSDMTQAGLKATATPGSDHSMLATSVEDQPIAYSSRDAMLYALGIGFGNDPQFSKELAYVFEEPLLKALPTFSTMLPSLDFPCHPEWDGHRALHIGQKFELFRPLPPAGGNLLANQRVVEVQEGGPDRGMQVVVQSDVRLASDDTAVFSLTSVLVAPPNRAFQRPTSDGTTPHELPARSPDLSGNLRTRPDQALLFRLSGDRNPLHGDAELAQSAGFDGPLLQGRCLFGIACRAILRTICDYDSTLITGMEARFVAPAYPGETVTTEMWQERNIVSFRCSVKARKTVVVDNGKCTLVG
jgi:acyl dehydratase